MKENSPTKGRGERFVGLTALVVQRLCGLALFGFGLFYWVRLVGIYPEFGWRFDLMPMEWRVAACAFAVLCPVAGVGLWLAVSWGSVVWLLVAALQGAMHTALVGEFGPPNAELAFHVGGLTLLGCLRILEWRLAARRRRR